MDTLKREMINKYNTLAFTHNYIFGFAYKGIVYMAHTTSDMMPYITSVSKASRGAGYALRFRPTTAQKVMLLQYATPICSTDYFKSVCESNKYNKGENYEKVVTEYYGQEWVKDSVPFTKAGDIVVDGIHYQIKFESASFCTEKSLMSLSHKA